MAGEFGRFIDTKRKGRGPGGTDILLKDIAAAMGVTATYLSDIVKGRRNPPEMETLKKIAIILQLSPEEKAEMYDLAGRERNEAAPDLPEYIMTRGYVAAALRTARDMGADEEDWKSMLEDLRRRKG